MSTKSHFLRKILCAIVVITSGIRLTGPIRSRAADIDFVTMTMTGTVVDQSNKPVANAKVTARTNRNSKELTTDINGVYRVELESDSNGHYDVSLAACGPNGDLGTYGFAKSYVEYEKVEPVKIVLKPARNVEVTVLDGDGRPLNNVPVYFGNHLHLYAEAHTGVDGRWNVQVPIDIDSWYFFASKSKVGFDYKMLPRSRLGEPPPAPPERVVLKLDGARPPLKIQTVDTQGKPLAGIRVGPTGIFKSGKDQSISIDRLGAVASDENGIAEIDWLPTDVGLPQPFNYSIIAFDHTYFIPTYWVKVANQGLTPAEAVTVTLERSVSISGQVTTADGKPAAGSLVTVAGQGVSSAGFRASRKTDSEGRYSLEVPTNSSYIITATKDKLAAPYKSGVFLKPDKPVLDADLVLGPGTLVRGVVSSSVTKKPVTASQMSLIIDKGPVPAELLQPGAPSNRLTKMTRTIETNDDGTYSFLLGPGDYQLRMRDTDDLNKTDSRTVDLKIMESTAPTEIVRDFSVNRTTTIALEGAVVDTENRPIPDVTVDGFYKSEHVYFTPKQTAEDGIIRLYRADEPLVLAALSDDRKLGGSAEIGEIIQQVRIVMKPTATAAGRLIDKSGKPIARVEFQTGVALPMGTEPDSPNGYAFAHRVTTDEKGEFRLRGLIVGQSYRIVLQDTQTLRFTEAKTKIEPQDANPIILGDVTID